MSSPFKATYLQNKYLNNNENGYSHTKSTRARATSKTLNKARYSADKASGHGVVVLRASKEKERQRKGEERETRGKE